MAASLPHSAHCQIRFRGRKFGWQSQGFAAAKAQALVAISCGRAWNLGVDAQPLGGTTDVPVAKVLRATAIATLARSFLLAIVEGALSVGAYEFDAIDLALARPATVLFRERGVLAESIDGA